MSPPWVRVSKLHGGRLARDLAEHQPTHVISLLDPSLAPEKVPAFDPRIRAFQRSFFDVEDETSDGPAHRAVADLLEFLEGWVPDAQDARLLSHCHMGASRSTAAAYLAFATHAGPGAEAQAFASFLAATTKPWPNRRMVALADELLGRRGAIVRPLDAYRDANPNRIGAYYRLNKKRGIFR